MPTDLEKLLKEDRQWRWGEVIVGLLGLGTSIFWLLKALRCAVDFIDTNSMQETNLVFGFAFAGLAGLTFLIVGLPLLICAAVSRPRRKALHLLARRVIALEEEMKKRSEHASPPSLETVARASSVPKD